MSSATSINIDEEARRKWFQLKNDLSLIWVTFKIVDGTITADDECKAPENESQSARRQRITTREDWGDFREKLSSAADNGQPGARYALYDLRFENCTNKPVFITWIPDDCGVKTRMVYASSNESLKSQLSCEGFQVIQANGYDDLDFDTLKTTLGRRPIV